MTVTSDAESMAAFLQAGDALCDDALILKPGECRLRVRSNSSALLKCLGEYFAHVVSPRDKNKPDLDVIAIESATTDPDVEFIDWKREPGKTGRKDAYCDLPDGRLVLKVRTGMVFLQSEAHRIAAGPCLKYDSQVINFINTQYMNWLQHRGWLICHAAGLVTRGVALGIAGFSGGGKSTLMLRLLDHAGMSYLTNDRLFVRMNSTGVHAAGIPKLPRVNPGTIVHNPKLHELISRPDREALLALPEAELWNLEDKYDVHLERVYGPGRITPQAPLAAFLVLNWRRDLQEVPRLERVDLRARRDLLGAIMKSPGPFYQYPDGSFLQDTTTLDEEAYLGVLEEIPVYEVRGGTDFDSIQTQCLRLAETRPGEE